MDFKLHDSVFMIQYSSTMNEQTQTKHSGSDPTSPNGLRGTSRSKLLDNALKNDAVNTRFSPRSKLKNRALPNDRMGQKPDNRTKQEEPRYTAQSVNPQKQSKFFYEPKLKIIPLGGVEETGGKNSTVFEYKNDIVVVDMGFMFPDETMPGVDYVLPDVTYLEQNKQKIRGLWITHAHLDHIGAIPYIYEKIGSPTIYGSPLSLGIIKSKLEEFGLDKTAKLSPIKIGEDVIQQGVFKISTFRLTHSIPQAMGIEIDTPEGIVVHTGDYKFDHTPADGKPADFSALAMIGAKKPLVMLSESTNIEKAGVSISEREIERSLLSIMENANQRIFVSTFSTLISRIQQILNVSKKLNRKICFVGRSMLTTVEIAISLEALVVPKDTIIDAKDLNKYSDDKIVIVCTGSQGEDNAALTRIANGEHRQVKMKRGDLVILSSSPIPGNERSVSHVMDNLFRAGAQVIYQKLMDVHTSGHANQEDIKLMLALIRPKYLIPIHGERHKLMMHCRIAREMGIVDENHCLVGDDGQVMEFSKGHGEVTNKRVPAAYVMVDGLGVGDVGNIVLRDRKAMAEEGIFVVIVTVDHQTNQVLTSPDIISRGFIYMRESEDLVHKARAEVKKIFAKYLTKSAGSAKADFGTVKQKLRDELSDFLFKETERKPMVIPVVIEV
ncbi:ribonuclease J [Candidatus Berkelbacteria bacterium CG10_big_fil_rev_8_21_14_0_10_43_13]|uniref:Ribonuclease J n=1 Tax=Candidatus Berkelbacteria bacterium CG10_big_fil_rev_8_21_14_0_10_43_13 TaxID=1974514 RepID=A0A2H0W5E7_9BACT|nr:MAG: ribonuclease J [Candidatus Berkelbacteria bacterium CG10_big_fil_rev_8_21_14_0_10_43_13]